MKNVERADAFLRMVQEVLPALAEPYAISGDAARCLWMLARASSVPLWKQVCHPWPKVIDIVASRPKSASGMQLDMNPVAQECRSSMLDLRVPLDIPTVGNVTVVRPEFVLAELLTEGDPLAVTRVADLLRWLDRDSDVDLEDVRAILKAVGAGDRFETLQQVAYVIPSRTRG